MKNPKLVLRIAGIAMLIVSFIFSNIQEDVMAAAGIIGIILLIVSFKSKKKPSQKTEKSGRDHTMTVSVAGINYRKKTAAQLCKGKQIEVAGQLIPDPDNEYDPDAIKICVGDYHLGYVPKDQTDVVRHIWDRIEYVNVNIKPVHEGSEHFYSGRAYIHYK